MSDRVVQLAGKQLALEQFHLVERADAVRKSVPHRQSNGCGEQQEDGGGDDLDNAVDRAGSVRHMSEHHHGQTDHALATRAPAEESVRKNQ